MHESHTPKPRLAATPASMASCLSAAALALLALAPPLTARAACQAESLQLPVKMVGSRAVATVGINGNPVPLTVDSGAFFSMLTDAAAAQLKLTTKSAPNLRVDGIAGRADTRITTVDKLQLLKGDIPRVQFVVGGNEPGAGTMGLMGRNLLTFTDTEFDLANGVIRFLVPGDGCARSNMAYWAGTTAVTELELMSEGRSGTPAIRVHVKLNGTELVALLDTGATTIVSLRAARRAGVVEADMQPAGTISGVGQGSAKAWTAAFEKFEFGGEAILHNRLRVADFDLGEADMLLGIDFFLSHRIYVSKVQEKIFVTYNGGTVFALNKGGNAGAVPFSGDAAASGAQAVTADQLARRGAAWAARGDYQRALADLNQACELEPASAAFLAQRGVVHEALRQPAQALSDFDKALALDPAQTDARLRRAALRFRARDRDGTKADLDALDQSLAPQAQMRLAMARAYLDLEQPEQALAQLNQWLAAHPNENKRDAALNSRCWARVLLGTELDKALGDCDDAIDSDSANAAYFDSRGWANLRLGRLKQALADFDRGLELRPGGAWSLYGRGLTKARLGDAAQGEADLMAARTAQPDIERRVAQAGLAPAREPKP